ncbi:MAG: Plug domain-containing protein, partial [Methylobacteriaceae bacterium]|nr:Plug domain-containing protein [Methylobacteriaceae bacterium]
MGVRVLLVASVSAAFVIESGQACAQDKGSYTTELPAVEISPPKTATRSGGARAPSHVIPRRVATLRAYPTTPVATPSTALAVDKVPSSINFVDSGQIQRANSLNITDALQQNVAALNINEVTGNPFQPDVEFRGFVGSPVSGTPQGLAVYQNGVRVNEAFGDTVNWDLIPTSAIKSVAVVTNNPAFGLNALGGAVTIQMKDGF